jgi:hypothetical protein
MKIGDRVVVIEEERSAGGRKYDKVKLGEFEGWYYAKGCQGQCGVVAFENCIEAIPLGYIHLLDNQPPPKPVKKEKEKP